ncbi:hypothetical protein [Zavarzinella formosa]|uniref:hypothetical protein n=1 Tax=Zavarzinella formosa TaxID=360055 RepID=UPI0003188394|nr:hypothetical protein [Zavarzinella formosa]
MKRYRWFGLGVVTLASALTGIAQEKDTGAAKEKGPEVAQEKGASDAPKRDEILEGFRAYVVNEPRYAPNELRNRTGKMEDLVCDHGLNPVIAVFSRTIPADASHPLNVLVAKLDALGDNYVNRRLGTYLVFLALKDEYRKDETRDARISEIQRFVKEATPKRTTIGLAEATETPDGTNQAAIPAQVTSMGIGADDDLVIVLYQRFIVVKRWKFKADAPPSEALLTELTGEVAKLLGPVKKRANIGEPREEPKAAPKKDEPKEEPKKEEPKKDE